MLQLSAGQRPVNGDELRHVTIFPSLCFSFAYFFTLLRTRTSVLVYIISVCLNYITVYSSEGFNNLSAVLNSIYNVILVAM